MSAQALMASSSPGDGARPKREASGPARDGSDMLVRAPTRLSTGYGRRFRRCNAVTRVIIFGCLGMALFGYDTGIVSGAMVLVRQDIKLDTDQTEFVVSITMMMAAMSTVLGIPANSLIGRKPVVMVSAVLYVIGSAIIAFANDYITLLVGRSLLGIAIGFASGTVPMYSAELSPPSMRGMVVTLNDLNIVFGQLAAALVNVTFQHYEGGWRISMGLAAFPAFLLFAGFMFLPESPRWLAMKGRLVDAEAVLQLIHDKQDVSEPLAEIVAAVKAEEEEGDGNASFGAIVQRGAKKLRSIWRHKQVRRAAILGIGLTAINQFSGINTVMYYSTTILMEAGFSRESAIWLAAMCCAAQLVGVIISVTSMDTIGRRATALRSCAGMVITLCLFATSFWCEGRTWDMVKVAALGLYLVAFGSGLSGVPWVLNAEIYPLRLRSAAVGQATFLNWCFNYVIGRYFLSVCEAVGTGGAFAMFAAVGVVGGIWMYFMLPETMGLELEDIKHLFSDPYPKAWWRGYNPSHDRERCKDGDDSTTEGNDASEDSDASDSEERT